MLKLFKPKSQFGRNIIVSSKANLIALILPIIITPMLTRLYTPTDFATFAVFISVFSILAAISSWKLDWHIPNTSTEQQAISLFFLSMFLSILIACVVFILIKIDIKLFYYWEGWIVIKPYIIWIPIMLVGATLSASLRALYIKKADLLVPSKIKIYEVYCHNSLQIFFGVMAQGIWGLIISKIISLWMGAIVLLKYSKSFFSKFNRLTTRKLYVSWRQHYKEATASTAVSLVNVINLSILPLLLIQYYSPVEVGWFTLMLRLAITPVGVITGAVSQSFWAEAARLIKSNKKELYKLYILNTKRLVYFAIPVTIFCLMGPYYVGWILGSENWTGAGYVLAALSPMIIGQIIVSPLSHLIIHKKQFWQLVWDIVRLILIIGTIVLFNKYLTMIELIWFISTISFMMYAILFFLNKVSFGADK